jgi:hypothetical protein
MSYHFLGTVPTLLSANPLFSRGQVELVSPLNIYFLMRALVSERGLAPYYLVGNFLTWLSGIDSR